MPYPLSNPICKHDLISDVSINNISTTSVSTFQSTGDIINALHNNNNEPASLSAARSTKQKNAFISGSGAQKGGVCLTLFTTRCLDRRWKHRPFTWNDAVAEELPRAFRALGYRFASTLELGSTCVVALPFAALVAENDQALCACEASHFM